MTQQELADKLGVSNKAVSRWERDECAPDLSVIMTVIFLNKAKEKRNDNDIFEEIEQTQIDYYNRVIGRYSFGSAF